MTPLQNAFVTHFAVMCSENKVILCIMLSKLTILKINFKVDVFDMCNRCINSLKLKIVDLIFKSTYVFATYAPRKFNLNLIHYLVST